VRDLGAVHRAGGGGGDEGEAVGLRLAGLFGFAVVGEDVDVGDEGVEERTGGFDESVGELGGDADRVADRERPGRGRVGKGGSHGRGTRNARTCFERGEQVD
jgi:hypothetical protein